MRDVSCPPFVKVDAKPGRGCAAREARLDAVRLGVSADGVGGRPAGDIIYSFRGHDDNRQVDAELLASHSRLLEDVHGPGTGPAEDPRAVGVVVAQSRRRLGDAYRNSNCVATVEDTATVFSFLTNTPVGRAAVSHRVLLQGVVGC